MDDQQFMNEQQLLTPKDVLGYAEEYIVVQDTQELLNFSLSNSLDDIEMAIYARTGFNVYLDKAYWRINTGLSINVKHLMNKHCANYSMTTWNEKEKSRDFVVNMRVGDKWYYTSYSEINGRIFNNEALKIQRKTLKLILNLLDIDINDFFDELSKD